MISHIKNHVFLSSENALLIYRILLQEALSKDLLFHQKLYLKYWVAIHLDPLDIWLQLHIRRCKLVCLVFQKVSKLQETWSQSSRLKALQKNMACLKKAFHGVLP